jgi:hypothetical protein
MPECGGKPCTHANLPLLGNHGCALCKCKLHGPCGVFFSEQSIKYQNICYECHRQACHVLGKPSNYPVVVATVTTQAATASQGVDATSAQGDERADMETTPATSKTATTASKTATIISKTATTQATTAPQGVAAKAATAQAATASKQAEKMALKSYDLKAVTWEDIVVGEVSSTRAQDKGMMVKSSVVTIGGYKSENFTADQIRQICAALKLSGYWSKSKEEALQIMAISKIHVQCYDTVGISEDSTKAPAKTKYCIFCLINVLFSEEVSAKLIGLG